MTDFPLKRDVLTVCESVLKSSSVDVEAFIDAYPANTQLDLPIEDLPDAVINEWYEDPLLYQNHFARALAKFTDDEEIGKAIGNNADVRISGYREDMRFYEVGGFHPNDVADEMVHLRGRVTDRSKKKLRDETVAFECQRCGSVTRVPQSGEYLQEPHECTNCERQGPFHEIDSRSDMRNFQTIRLQTLPEKSDDGETETIILETFDDMVGTLKPGDRVVANVIIRAKRESSGRQKSRVRTLEGQVESVEKLDEDHSDIEVDPYRDDIREIVDGDDTFDQVKASIAPNHEGDEPVKMAMAFQLFGGIDKELPDGTKMRGNSHVLLMGDPGAGKTAMMKYVANLSPRSEFATGKRSSEAGLTAGAVKDELGNGWALQAGTLVRANNGMAVIDELDKMEPDDRDGIIDAMSEQQITVNKIVSGVLPAKTSILAAANPKYGSFDPHEDLGRQLDLDEVLLSRFDLWFMMRDEVDEEKDEAVASQMTKSAKVGQKVAGDKELEEDEAEDVNPPIPPAMFRAYVAWAKQIFPVFTDEAQNRIVSEYVELRQSNDEDGPVPTTARIVEAIHRLSEASARIRLDENVLVEDVERAIDTLYDSLETLGLDPETGELDASRFETGTASSKHDKHKAVLGIIEANESDDEPADYEDVREEALVLMDLEDFDEILHNLKNKRDEIYEPKSGKLATL